MAKLNENIAKAIESFDSIKASIERRGVPVGDVPTTEYSKKIDSVPTGLSFKSAVMYGFKSFRIATAVSKITSAAITGRGDTLLSKTSPMSAVCNFRLTSPVGVLLNTIYVQEV